MSHTINPIGARIVAQAEEAATKTASGIILPGSAQEKPKTAKVIAIGSPVKDIKQGDRIIYKEYSATEIKIEKDNYLIINEEDILATVS